MHYYKFNIKDYAVSTPHLTNEEDLCYRRLLDLYYLTEKPITGAMHVLCRRLNCDEKTIQTVLEEFFVLDGEEWHHGRCDEEIALSKAITERKSAAAQKRWEAPAKHKQSMRIASAKHKQSTCNALPSTHNPLPNNNTPIVPMVDVEYLQSGESSETSSPAYSIDFLTFWEEFPEKKGKGAAWKVWQKIKCRPSTATLISAIRLQEVDRASARTRGEFYPEWKNPATWLAGACWEDGLKYAAKKEKAPAAAPENWRELLVDEFPENYPDGLASANLPSAFHLLPQSVQEDIRLAALEREQVRAAIRFQSKEAA